MKTNKRKSTETAYQYNNKPVGERWPVNFTNPYWSKKLRMDYLQRRIIVYSIQYYEMSETCVEDRYFDAVSHQLLWYMNNSTQEEKESTSYWYCMSDFDASTGFNLYDRLNKYDKKYLHYIASNVLHQYKNRYKN